MATIDISIVFIYFALMVAIGWYCWVGNLPPACYWPEPS